MQNIFHQMLTLSALTLSCAEENIMMVICFLQWDSFVVVYRTPGTTGMGKCTMFQQRKKKTTGICFHENQKFVQIICFISFWYSHISKEKKKKKWGLLSYWKYQIWEIHSETEWNCFPSQSPNLDLPYYFMVKNYTPKDFHPDKSDLISPDAANFPTYLV